MEIDELLDLIDNTDLDDQQQRSLLRALLVSETGQRFNKNNFDVELEALLIQVKAQSVATLDKNLEVIKQNTKTFVDGKPAQALVGGTYAVVNNWMGLIGGLIAPWKIFTYEISHPEDQS